MDWFTAVGVNLPISNNNLQNKIRVTWTYTGVRAPDTDPPTNQNVHRLLVKYKIVDVLIG